MPVRAREVVDLFVSMWLVDAFVESGESDMAGAEGIAEECSSCNRSRGGLAGQTRDRSCSL